MAKAALKTKKTAESVDGFLAAITDPVQREDSRAIVALMQQATRATPTMWGSAIIGFGHRVLKYPNGRVLDWMQIGFSPRKQNLTLYVLHGTTEEAALLKRLGEHTTGKGCLYIKRLADVDMRVLKQLIKGGL